MPVAPSRFPDRQRIAILLFGGAVAAQFFIELAEIVVGAGDVRMVLAQRLHADGKRPHIGFLGLVVASLLAIEPAEIVEIGGDLGMLGPQRSLVRLDRAQQHGFSFLESLLFAIELAEIDGDAGDVLVILAGHPAPDIQRVEVERLGFAITAQVDI